MNPIELFTNPLQSIALKKLGFDERSADCLIGATVQNDYGVGNKNLSIMVNSYINEVLTNGY